MKLKLVYGRSGTGKSQYIYEDIKNKLESQKNIFLIVPEQSNLSAERKLFEITGKKSLLNVEVLTLSRMAYRVLSEIGENKVHLSQVGKDMLIFSILNEQKRNLNFLGKSDKNIDIVNRMLTEFKKHTIDVEELKKVQLDDEYIKLKLQDITSIYENYEQKIKNEFIDETDSLDLLVEFLDKTDIFNDALIYIDEFLGFTPQEYRIFEKLVSVAGDITVSVNIDNLNQNTEKENDLFYFNKLYANRLIEIAEKKEIDIQEICLEETVRFKNEELKWLEANFDKNNNVYEKKVDNINLFLANNPYTEIEFVARKIHNLVKKCGYSYNEIGIITQDVEKYAYDAKSIFPKYDIPLFIDEKKELNQNILVKFIISLLDIFSKKWSYEAIFNYLKLGLLDIDKEDIYVLENYCIKWGIKGSKWYNREFNYEPINDVQEKLESIRKKIVNPLINFKTEVSNNRTIKEITKGIYNFLIENKIDDILDKKLREYNNFEISDEYNTSYGLLIQIFEEMCLIFENKKVTFETYKELFQVGLNASKLGKIPATQDQVILGDTERTRSNGLKVLFVIGVNDGTFPKTNKIEGYLNDTDRRILKEAGIQLAKTSVESLYEEQFNIYRTLTTPEKELYITYPSSDKEGKSIRPSILIKKLKRMFKELKEESDIITGEHILTNKNASFEEALTVYKEYLEGFEIDSVWEDILRYFYKTDKERFMRAISGIYYTNKAQEISKQNIQKLYGNTMYTSVSRLENYRRCPFSFHLTYGLKLKEKEELKINTIDTGSFIHEVIDTFFKELDDQNLNVKQITKEQIDLIAKKIIEDLLQTSKYYIFTSSAKFRLLTNRLKKVILESLEYIVYTLKNSDFSVLGHEIEFSRQGNFKPIVLSLEDKKIEITGKIDRVDTAKINDNQYVRIIDYKSSIKDLDLNQVMSGLQIQLITYLDAISEQEAYNPSGLLYLGLIDTIIKADKNLTDEEIENKIRKSFKMKGLLLADVSVIKMMDTTLESGSSDIIPVYMTKDGEISESKSNTIKAQDFNQLTSKVKEIIKDISKEILKGRIDIKPYYYKKKTGCDYCQYKTICMFNTNIKDNEYQYVSNKEKNIILEEIRKGNN